jgi:hypothetical protein
MSYAPYVPNKGKNGSAKLPQQNATVTTSSYCQKPSTSPYGTPSSAANPPIGFGAGMASTTPTPYNNAYGPAPHPTAATGYTTTTGNTNAYGSKPVGIVNPTPTTYNPYGNNPKTAVANNNYNNITPTSMLPDFAQALDHPPPTHHSVVIGAPSFAPGTTTSSQCSPSQVKRNDDTVVVATAYPVNQIGASGVSPSVMNSSIYQGGPTNGLISEGNPTKCHKVDYEIKGHEMQLVEIELDPGEVVIGEAGAMMFMEDNIKFEAKFGDGSEPKVRIQISSDGPYPFRFYVLDFDPS